MYLAKNDFYIFDTYILRVDVCVRLSHAVENESLPVITIVCRSQVAKAVTTMIKAIKGLPLNIKHLQIEYVLPLERGTSSFYVQYCGATST